jgi:hypothetical protein
MKGLTKSQVVIAALSHDPVKYTHTSIYILTFWLAPMISKTPHSPEISGTESHRGY